MTLQLSQDDEQLIRELVRAGRFPSATEAVAEAFRLLGDRHGPQQVAAQLTVFDVLDRTGLIGCLDGSPDTPADLSTNLRHLDGFGRD